MSVTGAVSPAQALAVALASGGAWSVDAGDRRALLAHAAGVSAGGLIMLGGDDFTPEVMARYLALLERRAGGEPVSKIRGQRAFWMHDFIVTPDVLDPRPETEEVVRAGLAAPFESVLDLGLGSGCILLSLLAERADVRGVGVDLSAPALDVARANAAALNVADRVAFLQSDWFAAVRGRFDLIVSNPPYISDAEMADLSVEVRDHDPHLALTPGGDGLAPYRMIAAQAGAFLTDQGRLVLEIGWQQGADVCAILAAEGWQDITVLPDMDGRDRVVTAQKSQNR